ncbi:response regulator [Bacteroidota bacterium]
MANGFEILLVEDTQADAKFTIRTLDKHGLADRLMWVKDGAEAMDFILARGIYNDRNPEKRPKLILLDLNLPKVNGLQFLENMRLRVELETIPVVVLTSSKADTDRLKSNTLGVNGFLEKPVEEEQFITAVKEVEMHGYFFKKA